LILLFRYFNEPLPVGEGAINGARAIINEGAVIGNGAIDSPGAVVPAGLNIAAFTVFHNTIKSLNGLSITADRRRKLVVHPQICSARYYRNRRTYFNYRIVKS